MSGDEVAMDSDTALLSFCICLYLLTLSDLYATPATHLSQLSIGPAQAHVDL